MVQRNFDSDVIDLTSRHCTPCEGGVPALSQERIDRQLEKVPGWEVWAGAGGNEIARTFKFEDFYQTMAFVNAVAWVANIENHHPDLEVGYNTCRVRYSTHAVKGLTDNDFICAAKVNALVK